MSTCWPRLRIQPLPLAPPVAIVIIIASSWEQEKVTVAVALNCKGKEGRRAYTTAKSDMDMKHTDTFLSHGCVQSVSTCFWSCGPSTRYSRAPHLSNEIQPSRDPAGYGFPARMGLRNKVIDPEVLQPMNAMLSA